MDAVKTNAKKTRALKKYEAAPVAFATDPGDPSLGDPSLALFSPFGPLIAQAAMPQALVERINRYGDQVVGDGAGMEFLVPKEVALDGGEQSLMRQTENLIRRYLALSDEPPAADVKIDVFWIVSQRAGTPSPVHFHSCDISGVFYLKTPQLDCEDEELQKTYISGRHAGYINFLIGGKQRFAKSLVSFRPRLGDLCIFPGWLLHGAEPFRGAGERRSLAFNAYVDAP
jgi:Putative 2OG-Fe(II) oxygenase